MDFSSESNSEYKSDKVPSLVIPKFYLSSSSGTPKSELRKERDEYANELVIKDEENK